MIIIGSDHGGFELRKELAEHLRAKGFLVTEAGSENGESVDYPDVAQEVCAKVISGEAEKAVLICGTGIGISIAANKIDGIRAALCTDCYMAKYTRLHNNANVLCLGGRVIGAGLACEIANTFFATDFEGGRHQRRIDKIAALEK